MAIKCSFSIFIDMSHYKIKLEDKAAFLNRLEKMDVHIDSFEVKDNKLKGYFELDIDNPEVDNIVKTILRQSPKIGKLKEVLRKLVREELKRK
jgi:hypothetical protein